MDTSPIMDAFQTAEDPRDHWGRKIAGEKETTATPVQLKQKTGTTHGDRSRYFATVFPNDDGTSHVELLREERVVASGDLLPGQTLMVPTERAGVVRKLPARL